MNIKKKIRMITSAITLMAMLICVPLSASASTYTYTTTKTPYNAPALSSLWTTKKTTTSTSYTPILKTKKIVTEKKYQTAADWFTDVKSVSSNFRHVKGNADLTANVCISKSHTISVTASGEAKSFGASLGYSKSVTTSKSVSKTISPKAETGYYYFGVKAKCKDFRVLTTKRTYTKRGNTYSLTRSELTNNAAVQLYSNPLYYDWYKAK